MAIKTVTPYLNFDGTARDAITLYEKALGAKSEGVMPFDKDPNRVMHAVVILGAGRVMISDTMPGMPLVQGSNAHVTLDYDDVDEMRRAFAALGEGGKVTMPLQDTFWGATFGMLTDRYGINWMFNATKAPA
ncbi:MAG TPA: VOC family protein [Kofleriaceae bacterium]|jgi:PhnB protein|nr:VOC family protein [Kofleriaceae bacterium]